jgi:hypothetical protein
MKILFRGCLAVCRRVGLPEEGPEEITRPLPFCPIPPTPFTPKELFNPSA